MPSSCPCAFQPLSAHAVLVHQGLVGRGLLWAGGGGSLASGEEDGQQQGGRVCGPGQAWESFLEEMTLC